MNTDQSTIRNHQSAIVWVLAPSLALIAVVLFDLPILRGTDEWRWPLRSYELTTRLLLPIVTLGLYVFVSARWLRGFAREIISRRYERWFLLFVTLAAPGIPFALAYAVSHVPLLEFFGPTVSVHNSGYFTTAISTPDLNQLLANFPSQMPLLPIHAQSHPPGAIIAHWLSWQVLQALPALANSLALPLRTLQCHNPGLMALDNAQISASLVGMLLPLIGAFAVWPMYAFARRVTSVFAAVVTVLIFPLLPLFAMWPAQWDQFYPLLLFIALYWAQTGLEKNSLPRILLSGIPLSIATFFSIGNFVLILIVALYGIAWLWLHHSLSPSLRHSLSHFLRLALAFALGCASIWLVYWLFYGVNPFSVISTGSRLAFESTTGNRSVSVWLLGNPIDFAVFLGFPIVFLLLYNLIKRLPFPKSLLPIAFATFGALILLWLSGIVRGEVGRLWMYFGPLLVLIAVAWYDEGNSLLVTRYCEASPWDSFRFPFSVFLIALLAVQLLSMNTRWLVNDSFLDEPPERAIALNPPSFTYPASASFADQIALRGYDLHSSARTLHLVLHWRAITQPPRAYTVFVHVLDWDGRSIGQQDNMPAHDQLPTSCWQPSEYISDPYTIRLADQARGPYTIEVGLYRGDTGARLPRSDAPGDTVTLSAP